MDSAKRRAPPAESFVSAVVDPRAFLAAVVSSTDDAIVTKDLDGNITSWNPAAERIFGFSAAEALGKPIFIIIPDERRAEEEEIISRIRRGGRIEHFETVRRAKDGRHIDVSLSVSPINDETGRVIGASKVSRDITERKREEKRRKFLSDATAAFGLSLDFESTTRSVVRLAVPTLADFAVLDLLAPDDDAIRRVAWFHGTLSAAEFDEISRYGPPRYSPTHFVSRAIATGTSSLVPMVDRKWIENFAVSPAHARCLIRLGLRSLQTVILAARGRTLGALSLCMAESGRMHTNESVTLAEEYARRASEAVENAILYRDAQTAIADREKFLSIASHELKTPLTTLQLQLQAALRTLQRTDPDAARRAAGFVANAERQGSRIGRLVNELLDISRISAGKLSLQVEYFDLTETVRDVVEHFRPELDDKRITVEVRAPEPVRGRWDRFRIDQVVTNLLSNAIKYGNAKPIEITVQNRPNQAVLVIEDHGDGMDPAFLRRIFKPFEQAESAVSHGGLGLGLHISRQVVEAHGGTIAVTSTPGNGSTFRIELPRQLTGEPEP